MHTVATWALLVIMVSSWPCALIWIVFGVCAAAPTLFEVIITVQRMLLRGGLWSDDKPFTIAIASSSSTPCSCYLSKIGIYSFIQKNVFALGFLNRSLKLVFRELQLLWLCPISWNTINKTNIVRKPLFREPVVTKMLSLTGLKIPRYRSSL